MRPGTHSAGCAMARGAIGFSLVSLAGFSVWTFGGNWFYRHAGEGGLYLACAVVFIALSGICLQSLVGSKPRLVVAYKTFIPAFLAYAVIWSVCWFVLKFGAGEWLGSLAGCAVFALVLRQLLKAKAARLGLAILVLFLAHSAGYFAGSLCYSAARHPPAFLSSLGKRQMGLLAKTLWGLCYGLGFGAGIGYAYHTFQREERPQ